ncbi:MAG: hypothetical protein KDA20_03840 [Phycisphaerales bacterium]|nr:hypothetical protein [Phycisphaerales bacterium]
MAAVSAYAVGPAGLFVYDGSFPNRIWEADESIPGVENVRITQLGIGSPEFELHEGFFYVSQSTSPTLHKLDPITGATVSSIALTFPAGNNVITAMESVGPTLYCGITTLGGGNGRLATVDLNTGVVTLVGSALGINSPLGGLAYDTNTNTMYGINARWGGNARLYTFNLVTGVATINSTLTPTFQATGLEMGLDGVLYALGRSAADDNYLFSIDPTTFTATRLGLMANLLNATAITSGIVSQPCPEDVDGSGAVDLGDISAVLFNFGQAAPPAQGDVDGSGLVDLADLSAILFAFGQACP